MDELLIPADIVSKFRDGAVSRECLLDYVYEKEHPRLFRFRKRLQAGCERWKQWAVRFMDRLPVPRIRDLRDPKADFAFGKPLTVVICLLLLPYTIVVLPAFWLAFAVARLWRAPFLVLLNRHRASARARLATTFADLLASSGRVEP